MTATTDRDRAAAPGADVAATPPPAARRPRDPDELHAFVRRALDLDVPRRAVMPDSDAPFDYLVHAFFEDRAPRDCIVWANRGGGKTQLGAVATLLDMMFKPGIQIRILGGSFDQSSRMYAALRRLLEESGVAALVAGRVTGRSVELANGSRVEVLSQSERAVRGHHVHKLRCDEVELFDPDVWAAAQLVTRSGRCGDVHVRGAVEAISTMHRPFGLMQRLVRDATPERCRIFRWTLIDTLVRCPPARSCATCSLHADCAGRARVAAGFVAIDDAIQAQRRVDRRTWDAEMLCAAPTRSDSVYPEFDEQLHVAPWRGPRPGTRWVGGMDFGFRAPTVLLRAVHDARDDVVHVVDELVTTEATTDEIIARASASRWPRPSWIGADPAGHQRSEHTGRSTIALWRRAGYAIRARRLPVEAGISTVRRRLRAASGELSLRVDPRCTALVEALAMYHYPPDRPEAPSPVKDGHDHAADALRYLLVNLDDDRDAPWGGARRWYV